MPEFSAFTLSPMRVHQEESSRLGIRACWQHLRYVGGRYSTEHFRTCSYCGCIHPGDMIDLLNKGRSRLIETGKGAKFLFVTPNPVAGDLVVMGSLPGPVFKRTLWPQDLKHHLYSEHRRDLQFEPTIAERLSGHFERPTLEEAPAEIEWPFFTDHTTERQWLEILAAANHGESNAKVQSA